MFFRWLDSWHQLASIVPGWVVRKVLLDDRFRHVTFLLQEFIFESLCLYRIWHSHFDLAAIEIRHLISVVPTVEIPLVHREHLGTQLHLIVKNGTPPQCIILISSLLTRHVNQLGSFIISFCFLVFSFCFLDFAFCFLTGLLLLLQGFLRCSSLFLSFFGHHCSEVFFLKLQA